MTIKNTKLGVAAQARLRYKFPKTSLDLKYQRFETSGSGLFAGAQSNIVRLSCESSAVAGVERIRRQWGIRPTAGCNRCRNSN